MLACLAGGVVVIWTSVPRYEASARVLLNYIKPDPVTGAQVPTKMAAAYVNSQIQFIRDYQVTVPAAASLGMLDSPQMVDSYAALPADGRPAFRLWVAQHIMGSLNAVPVEDSSIIEIRYRAPNPRAALEIVEAVRTAYVDASVDQRRAGAEAGANALLAQAAKAKSELVALQAEHLAIEKKSGVIIQEGHKDFDTAILRNLARGTIKTPEELLSLSTPSAPRLANVEADLALAMETYGPNHPRVVELNAQLAQLKAQVAQESAFSKAAAQSVVERTRATAELLDKQKAKVLDQRPTTTMLRLLQDEITSRSEQIDSLMSRAADLRQLATSRETSFTPIGPATVKPKPVFPSRLLILPGTGLAGLALGILLALLSELLARRIRNPDDLRHAARAPVLGLIPQVRAREGVAVRVRRARRTPRKKAA